MTKIELMGRIFFGFILGALIVGLVILGLLLPLGLYLLGSDVGQLGFLTTIFMVLAGFGLSLLVVGEHYDGF